MDNKQSTFYNVLYEKVKASHKSYAKKILYVLYPDKSLNQSDIVSKFSKKHSKMVSASIKDLEECNLIKNVTISKSPKSEQQYILTKPGKQLVESENNFL